MSRRSVWWFAALTFVLIWSPLAVLDGAEILPASYGEAVHSHPGGEHAGASCCQNSFNPWAGYCQEKRGLHLSCGSCLFQNLLCPREPDCCEAAPACSECTQSPLTTHVPMAPQVEIWSGQTSGHRLSAERRRELETIRQRLAEEREAPSSPVAVSPPFYTPSERRAPADAPRLLGHTDAEEDGPSMPELRLRISPPASPLAGDDPGAIDDDAIDTLGRVVTRILIRSIMVGAVHASNMVDEARETMMDEGSPFESDDQADETDEDDLFGP